MPPPGAGERLDSVPSGWGLVAGVISLPSGATTAQPGARAVNEGPPADANSFSACRRRQVRQPCGGGHDDAQAEEEQDGGDEQAN